MADTDAPSGDDAVVTLSETESADDGERASAEGGAASPTPERAADHDPASADANAEDPRGPLGPALQAVGAVALFAAVLIGVTLSDGSVAATLLLVGTVALLVGAVVARSTRF